MYVDSGAAHPVVASCMGEKDPPSPTLESNAICVLVSAQIATIFFTIQMCINVVLYKFEWKAIHK